MTSVEAHREKHGQREVGRCYTRARRLPLMIGRLPGSDAALWGGPYTVTQVVVACSTAVVLWWSRDLWAVFGIGWNGAILLGLPITAALLVRRARVEGRDPLRVGLGVVSAVTAPAGGRTLTGAPWSFPRGVRIPSAGIRITTPTAPTSRSSPTTAASVPGVAGHGGRTSGHVARDGHTPGRVVSQEEVERLNRLRATGLDELDEAEVDELLVAALRLYRQEHGRHRRDNNDGDAVGGGAS